MTGIAIPSMPLARRSLLLALPALAVSRAGRAGYNGRVAIPDVAVFCDTTLLPALHRAAALFAAPVHLFATTPQGMLAQIARETQTDVLITLGAAIDDGAARKLVQPPTRRPLGANPIVIARRAGDRPAPVAEDAAAIRVLLAEGKLAAPDPTPASTLDTQAILDSIGAAELLRDRLDGTPDTPEAASRVAEGRARFALVYLTDVYADSRLTVAARPGPAARYDAVAAYGAASPNTQPFLDFLHTGEAGACLRDAGLEPA